MKAPRWIVFQEEGQPTVPPFDIGVTDALGYLDKKFPEWREFEKLTKKLGLNRTRFTGVQVGGLIDPYPGEGPRPPVTGLSQLLFAEAGALLSDLTHHVTPHYNVPVRSMAIITRPGAKKPSSIMVAHVVLGHKGAAGTSFLTPQQVDPEGEIDWDTVFKVTRKHTKAIRKKGH